jgi:hypothetical protein
MTTTIPFTYSYENQQTPILSFLLNTNKKMFYLFGNCGIGKTDLILNLLHHHKYKPIHYSYFDLKKNLINEIQNHFQSNLFDMYYKNPQKKIIVIDSIDFLTDIQKEYLSQLIKWSHHTPTKHKIILIGNNSHDNKIKECIHKCDFMELQTPSYNEKKNLFYHYLSLQIDDERKVNEYMQHLLTTFQYDFDLRKIKQYFQFNHLPLQNSKNNKYYLSHLFQSPTVSFTNNQYLFENETILGYLWYENVIYYIDKLDKKKTISFYIQQLKNLSYSDKLTSFYLIYKVNKIKEWNGFFKIIYNNLLLHSFINIQKLKDIRNSKIPNKISLKTSNEQFILFFCQKLNIDKPTLYSYIHKDNELDLPLTSKQIKSMYFLNEDDISIQHIDKLMLYYSKIQT